MRGQIWRNTYSTEPHFCLPYYYNTGDLIHRWMPLGILQIASWTLNVERWPFKFFKLHSFNSFREYDLEGSRSKAGKVALLRILCNTLIGIRSEWADVGMLGCSGIPTLSKTKKRQCHHRTWKGTPGPLLTNKGSPSRSQYEGVLVYLTEGP